jgi:hypothetical protein
MKYERKEKMDTCGKCFEGVVFAIEKNGNGASFVFKCPCHFGSRSYVGSWPMWSETSSLYKREVPNWKPGMEQYA